MLPIGKRRVFTTPAAPTGKQDTNLMNARKAMGSTPQFSPEATKKIQGIIDPTGANVGRQAVPIMGGNVPRPSQDAMKQAFASQGERSYNTKPTGPVASPSQMISTLANKAIAPQRTPMMKKGGKVSSASKRADGIAVKGKTKGKIC